MDATTATSGPTWTLPGIDALGPATGELAGFGLFDEDDSHETTPGPTEAPTAAPSIAAIAEPVLTTTGGSPAATEAVDGPWTLPNRPAWDRPDNAVWAGPEPLGATATVAPPVTAPLVAPAAFAPAAFEPAAFEPAAFAPAASDPMPSPTHAPIAAATETWSSPQVAWPAPAEAWPGPVAPVADRAPSDHAVDSPATLADVVAAVRGREQAPWAAPGESAAAEHPSAGFVLDDVITTTAFPRAEHVAAPHVAHELAPREHHAPLESVLRTHAPDTPEVGSPAPASPVAEDFDADAFAAALHGAAPVEGDAPATGRRGRRGLREEKPSKAERARTPEKTRKGAKTREEAKVPEAEPWAKAAKERSPRRGRKAEQAAVFERMTAPRPGTAAPVAAPVEELPVDAPFADDPFVVDHVAAAPTPRRDEPSRGRKGRTTPTTAPRGRLGRRRDQEPDMLDRLQGRFPSADPAAVPGPVIEAPADALGLRGSPTLDHLTSDQPMSDHATIDDHADGLAATTWPVDERWGSDTEERDDARGIFAKRPPRTEEPLSGGKALALRLLAVVCIAGGLLVGWRTLHAPSNDETPAPAPTTVATMPAATVVAEAPTTVPMADATADPNAMVDPNAVTDPNAAVVDPNATVTDPNAAAADPTTDGGDFFEPPKDYSAR